MDIPIAKNQSKEYNILRATIRTTKNQRLQNKARQRAKGLTAKSPGKHYKLIWIRPWIPHKFLTPCCIPANLTLVLHPMDQVRQLDSDQLQDLGPGEECTGFPCKPGVGTIFLHTLTCRRVCQDLGLAGADTTSLLITDRHRFGVVTGPRGQSGRAL